MFSVESRGRRRLTVVFRLILIQLTVLSAELCGDEPSAGYREPPITEGDRLHWSFRPLPAEIAVPSASSETGRNEIDRFVSAALAEAGLTLQPEARRRTLIRRLSLDLTGLPPAPSEIDEFIGDASTQAYDRLVDRLLASPGYGEHWAQHWLDLARFAETDGFEHDRTRPEAWTYRDWVIGSLNKDMPYDEFLRRQIAGDELAPHDESAATATRFCLSGPDMPDINLTEERRHNLLNELTSMIGEVVLGLQIGCAQCHDHKYDPLSQADFYRLRAIFEPAVQLQKNKSVTGLSELSPNPQKSYVMLRGDFRRRGPEVPPGVPRVLSSVRTLFQPVPSNTTAGLRTALADWLVSRDNPLTARVIVNRVWQQHFGAGLVDTPGEFGVMGADPSHRELLDWLAIRLMDDDWSLKKLHRLIVTSATWRQASLLQQPASAAATTNWKSALEHDPQARLLSRYPRRRLNGETIRDAMLAAAGWLNRKAGGPGIRPPLPQELVGTLLKNQWNVTADVSEHSRRSIYVFARRNLRYPIFEVFDRPSANASCSQRGVSTTAPQSLHLLNSEFSLDTAQHLADLVTASKLDQAARVAKCFLRTLGRLPDNTELADVEQFLKEQSDTGLSARDQLTHLCLALFNSSEFIFPD